MVCGKRGKLVGRSIKKSTETAHILDKFAVLIKHKNTSNEQWLEICLALQLLLCEDVK